MGMLSVVIGTLNHERALVRTLASLVPAAATGVVREVIIADRGSRDGTLEVADVAGCDVVTGDASLAQALRAGAAKARAAWLMFLQPGTILDPAWADEAAQFVQQMDLLDQPPQRAAAFRRGSRIGADTALFAEAMALLRASLTGRVAPAQGLVIAKQHYDHFGGHRIAAADTERDLARRIGRRRITVLRSRATMLSDN